MNTLFDDLRFVCRQLRKSPGFVVVAVVTLALGIGVNTALFSVVDKLLVRTLPVPHPNQLILLGQPRSQGSIDYDFNYPLFRDYQRDAAGVGEFAATAEYTVGLRVGAFTERQRTLLVSGNYFDMLGVNAALGRTFAPDEGVAIDDAAVVVLSHRLWRQGFGADPGVIGRVVTLSGKPFTVIGVTPREFTGTTRGRRTDLYVPITLYGRLTDERPGGDHPLESRYFTWHRIIGRLNEGVTPAQARSTLLTLSQRMSERQLPNTPTELALLPGAQGFTDHLRDTRLPLHLLVGASVLVLLIGCANLANLQLARAKGRVREDAVRLALGARQSTLLRLRLQESLLLALGGGALGLVLTGILTRLIVHFRPPDTSIDLLGGLDPRVLLFAFFVSVLAGVLFGMGPALRSGALQLIPALKGETGRPEGRSRQGYLRGALAIFQVGLSLLVLISAGLCVRSLQNLQDIDPGFDLSPVVMMSFGLGLNDYDVASAKVFYDQLLQRARELPGVEAATLSASTPLDGNAWGMSFVRIDGYQHSGRGGPSADTNAIARDFFRTLGVRLLRGRDFDATDAAPGVRTVIVNDAFVQRYWPGQEPLGKRLYPYGDAPMEVVGVVETTRSRYLTDSPRPKIYFPLDQHPGRSLSLSVRTGVSGSAMIRQLRDLVRTLDADVPTLEARTLGEQRDGVLSLQRLAALLLSGLGLLALALASLGIYAVLAYAVSRRTREIGVRMALGAQVGDVLYLVLRQGIGLTGIGLILGLTSALVVTRLMRAFLYEVTPLDPGTFIAVTLLLLGVAALACLLPARRAARVDPMEALRYE